MSTPNTWVPTIDGAAIDPLGPLAELELDDMAPRRGEHDAWTKGAMVRHFAAASGDFGDLWAAVLAIWRLKCLEGWLEEAKGKEARLWARYLKAWVVRSGGLWVQHELILTLEPTQGPLREEQRRRSLGRSRLR